MISKETAIKLKEAGYPQKHAYWCEECQSEECPINKRELEKGAYKPDLADLVKECGNGFVSLERHTRDPFTHKPKVWYGCLTHKTESGGTYNTSGPTGIFGYDEPEEAVAALYLELNK